ncbi:MAG: hypothetical protein H6540_00040 [Bacteroidales bacterium]|nr:hypothetical protein [Bacteroidales bacterium]
MKTRIYIFLFILLTVSFSGFSRNVNAQVNFGFNSGYKYLKGSEASTLPSNWYLPGFDDRAWSSGTAPFRYGDGSGGTLLDDMMNSYSTVYMRSTFNASYVSKLSVLNVSLDFDDGFNLFINGNKVISENAPDNPEYNSFSTALRESGVINNYSLQNVSSIIHEGVNTIAVQGFNTSLESSDFYFDMSIVAV